MPHPTPRHLHPDRHRASQQRGLTLIELMVALTIGLLLVLSMLAMLANSSANGQNLVRASMQIENGRYTMELLQDELRLAGFVGELPAPATLYTPGLPDPFSTPDPCATLPTGAFAFDAGQSPALTVPAAVQGVSATDTLDCLNNRQAGSDALVVRRLATRTTDVAALPTNNAAFHVQYSFCADDPTVKLRFAADKSALSLRNRGCTGANPARAYVSRVYFVASCHICGQGGDNIPTLKRLDLVGNQLVETPLVEGIETLRFEYGFDTDGDGAVDTWQPELGDAATDTGSWGNVVAVKAHFIARSIERVQGAGLSTAQTFQFGDLPAIQHTADGHVRHGYSTVIRLVNPSSIREGA